MFGSLRPKPDARMLRRVAARLKVPPSRCVLVEDTLRAPEGGALARHAHGLDAALARRPLPRRLARPAQCAASRRGDSGVAAVRNRLTCMPKSARSGTCTQRLR